MTSAEAIYNIVAGKNKELAELAEKEEAKSKKKLQRLAQPPRRRGSRKTYLLDVLRLDTTRGLPPPIRARLLLLAYYEKSRLVWQKITKLIKPMIKTGMSQSKAEFLRVLTGEKVKAVKPYVAIVRASEGEERSNYVSGYILEWGGHRRFTPDKESRRDGFSIRHHPEFQDTQMACWTIDLDKPANAEESLVVRLVDRTQKHQLNYNLYLLVAKADGRRPGERRSYGKWLLRDRKGRMHLLIDDVDGLRLEAIEETLL